MRRSIVVLSEEPDGSARNVTVPALPGCFTWGTTVETALAMARDAITSHLDGEPAAAFPAPGETLVAEVEVAVEEADGVISARHALAVGNGARKTRSPAPSEDTLRWSRTAP